MIRLLAALLLTFCVAPSALAQAAAVDREGYHAARTELTAALDELATARAAWEAAAARVEVLKRDVLSDPLAAFALPDALRAAHAAAGSLASVDARVRAASRRVDAEVDSLREQAAQRLAAMEAELAGPSAAAVPVLEMNELVALLDELDAIDTTYEPVPLDAILRSLDDTPEELRAAADELADHEARLARQLEDVRAGVARAEARERLEQRVGALGIEERLFDDSGFRRTTQRAASSGAGVETRGAEEGAPTAAGAEGVAGNDVDSAAAGGGADDSAAPPEFGAEAPERDFGEASQGGSPTVGGDPLPVSEVAAPGEPARLVDGGGPGADPTLRGLAGAGEELPSRRRGRGGASELRMIEEALARDLESVRAQRAALEAQAAALEGVD